MTVPPETWDRDIHSWFNLTYASYLTLPRSLLQSMPMEWQVAFVKLLDEMDEHFWGIETPRYTVSARDADGRFVKDPYCAYDRGRRFIPAPSGSAS